MNGRWSYVAREASEAVLKITVLGAAFITPMMVIQYGYSASLIRQAAFIVLVLFGWSAYLATEVFGGGAWQLHFSKRAAAVLGFGAAVLASAAFGGNMARSIGADSRIVHLGAFSLLAVPAYAVLLGCYCRNTRERFLGVLAAYFAGSTLLSLLTLGWWVRFRELPSFWDGGPAAQAMWLAVNAVLLAGLCSHLPTAARRFWGALLAVHLVLLAAYGYDASWYAVFGGAVALLAVEFFLRRRAAAARRERGRYAWNVAVALVSAALLLVPVRSLVPGWGTERSAAAYVPSGAALSWFVSSGDARRIILGAGPGVGVEAFWNLAEDVDMRSFNAVPVFENVYVTVLWDGGVLLALAVLSLLFFAAYAPLRDALSGTRFVFAPLSVSVLLLGASAFVMPASFAWFFSLAVFSGFSVADSSRTPDVRRPRLALGRYALLAALLVVSAVAVSGAVRRIGWKAASYAAVTEGEGRVSLEYPAITALADAAGPVSEYRLLRAELSARTVGGVLSSGADITPEAYASGLATLEQDMRLYISHAATGAAYWRMAAAAGELGASLASAKPPPAASDPASLFLMDPRIWYGFSEKLYRKAEAELPFNKVLQSEISRFRAARE